MSSLQHTREYWGKELARDVMQYPSEFAVRFLASCPKTEGRTAADIGFGSGQHLALLLEKGYRTSGLDLLPEAIERARGVFGNSPLLGDLFAGELHDAPWTGASFDVLICYGMIFLKPVAEMQRDLEKLRSLLKPDGRLLLDFRTPHNSIHAKGKDLGDGHFLLDERAGSYAGAAYTFLDKSRVRSLVKGAGLQIENLERWDWWKNNGTQRHSWWIVWAVNKNVRRRK